MGLTLASLEAEHHGSLDLGDDAADLIYRIASSAAKHNPAIMLARVQHLLTSGRWIDRRGETEALLAGLKGHASLQAPTWTAEAMYAAGIGATERAREAIRRGKELNDAGFEELRKELGL